MRRPNQVTREIPPCKDCFDRSIACHCKCEKYKTWKENLEKINNERKEYNKLEAFFSKLTR